jgi:hypothetical protein
MQALDNSPAIREIVDVVMALQILGSSALARHNRRTAAYLWRVGRHATHALDAASPRPFIASRAP